MARLLYVSLLVIVFCSTAQSETVLKKVDGLVWLKKSATERTLLTVGKKITLPAIIVTDANTKAVIVSNDNTLLMGAESEINLVKPSWFQQLSGYIYYNYHKRLRQQENAQVRVSTATLGIRGTAFGVELLPANEQNPNDEFTVSLYEGLVECEPLSGQFELSETGYDSTELMQQEFERFKAYNNAQFETYKREWEQAFTEYVDSIQLEQGAMLRVRGSHAVKSPLNEQAILQRQGLLDFGKEYIKH